MSQPADEARNEIVTQEVAHEEFAAERRHEAHVLPAALDETTLERLEHSS